MFQTSKTCSHKSIYWVLFTRQMFIAMFVAESLGSVKDTFLSFCEEECFGYILSCKYPSVSHCS